MLDPDDETFRHVGNDEFYQLFECAPVTTGRTIMHRRGFCPLSPEDVPENEITGRLWELLYALAGHRCIFHGTDGFTDAGLYQLLHHLALRNFFVTHTDHLNDTELYAELWHKALREESLLPAVRTRTGYWMHDIPGSYGTEECNLQLAIYATNEERPRHTRRDWRLPRPPF